MVTLAGRGRSMLRRALELAVALVLAAGALAAGPGVVRAAPTGCDTVALASPAALKIHVTAAGCGDITSAWIGNAVLTERRSGQPFGSWQASMGPVTLADATVDVPAPGWYDLVVTSVSLTGQQYQTAAVQVADGGRVTITQPTVGYRAGTLTSAYRIQVDWTKIGTGTAAKYQVQRLVDSGSFAYLGTTTATAYNTSVLRGHTYQFRVRGVSRSGVAGPWRVTARTKPQSLQEGSGSITFAGGTWSSSSSTRYWGGHVRYATRSGRTASFSIFGSGAAIVSTVGPNRGSFRVYVDGVYRRIVSTYGSSMAYRQVVYSIWWPQVGTHTIVLKVVGTAGHPRVDVDGAVTLSGLF